MRARELMPAGNEKGATAVEFALVLPLLLLVVFGVIEWGLYMYNRQVITNAVREGARQGVLMRPFPRDLDAEDIEICNRIMDFDTRLVTFGNEVLNCVPEDNIDREDSTPPPEFGSNLTVWVEYEYDFLFLKLPPLDFGPLTIRSEATMKME